MQRYRARLSGPLLDRIDLHVEVPKVPHEVLRAAEPDGPTSAELRDQVGAARARQLARAGKLNQALTPREIPRHCPLEPQALQVLERATERLGLSARAYHRVIKVARTIADLDQRERLTAAHVSEAVAYRRLDRQLGL